MSDQEWSSIKLYQLCDIVCLAFSLYWNKNGI